MSFRRLHKSKFQGSPTPSIPSSFAPRPVSLHEANHFSSQEEIEHQAFQQDKFEASGLQFKKKDGTITPTEQERLELLQARVDGFWTQRLERAKSQPNLLEILIHNAQPAQSAKPTPLIQPKLTIGQPNDRYEQEADRVARQVTSMPDSATQHLEQQRLMSAEEPAQTEFLQQDAVVQEERQSVPSNPELHKPDKSGGQSNASFESQLNHSRGGGSPLPEGVRSLMEPRFGADFSRVRVHTDERADRLNDSIQAKAFTTGQDVFFRRGAYNPGSRSGQELIAHELTHVVQQTGVSVQPKTIGTYLSSIYRLPVVQPTRERSNAFSGGKLPNISGVDRSSSPFLPEYDDDEVPGWKDDVGVPEWAKAEYRQESKRTVICSMTPDQKIGSVYFGDEGRIRTTHSAGPAQESHKGLTTVQFNIDEKAALRVFQQQYPKEQYPTIYGSKFWKYFYSWVRGKLKNATLDNTPSWAVLVDNPDAAYDLAMGTPPENIKLVELFKNINGEIESWHPSRGIAAKFETDKQVISVLYAAINRINRMGLKDAKERNKEFYAFVASRLPRFVIYMRRPDQV